jgi:fatty acid desaturase
MIGIIPVFLASYVLGMLFDWVPHTPTRQQGRYQNTRSYLFPGLKYLTLGQNYHHIHHLYPRVSWYHYERVFNLIRPELEANNAPIETLFLKIVSSELPSFAKSTHASEPAVSMALINSPFMLRVFIKKRTMPSPLPSKI